VGSGVPGIKKSFPPPRRQTDVEILGHAQKSLKSLIANAKGSGKETPLMVFISFSLWLDLSHSQLRKAVRIALPTSVDVDITF